MTKRLGSRASDFDAALRDSISYCPDTGLFTWRLPPRCGASSGVPAGNKDPRGYVSIGFRSRVVYAHRLAWFIVNGEWPTGVIDHINGDRGDNRICNLRDVSQTLNVQNVKRPQKRNKTGFLGVRPSANGRTFVSQITVNGRCMGLGSFATPEAAHQAYLDAKRRLHPGCTI